MDLISVDPIFNLYNREWPILTWQEPLPPAKFVFADEKRMGHALDSMVCAGVVVSGGEVRRSVLSPERARPLVRAGRATPCVMPGVEVGRGAVVRRAILDKNVVVAPGRAGRRGRRSADRERFTVSRRRDRRGRQGRRRGGVACGSRCSRASTRRRSTAGRACTSSTWRASWRGSSTSTVHCWGGDREEPGVVAHRAWDALGGSAPHLAALQAMSIDLTMAAGVEGAEVVHSHTWYANLGGPPRRARPRRAARRDRALARAAAAVEGGAARRRLRALELVRADRARGRRRGDRGLGGDARRHPRARTRRSTRRACAVVYNGIDADEYAPDAGHRRARAARRRPGRGPSVVFVGRITRQKGVPYLLDAALEFDPGGAARALRGGARHAGDRRRGRARGSSGCGRSAGT